MVPITVDDLTAQLCDVSNELKKSEKELVKNKIASRILHQSNALKNSQETKRLEVASNLMQIDQNKIIVKEREKHGRLLEENAALEIKLMQASRLLDDLSEQAKINEEIMDRLRADSISSESRIVLTTKTSTCVIS